MSDELEPLSPKLRALLDGERSAPVPSAAGAQERLLGLLAAAGGAAPVAPPSSESPEAPLPPAAPGGAAPAVWTVGKSLVVAATTGALGFAGGLAVPRNPEPAPVVEPAPAPLVPAPAPEVTPLPSELAEDAGHPVAPKPAKKRPTPATVPASEPAPEAAPAPAPAPSPSPATTTDIEHVSERQLIDAARVALGRNRAHDALLFLMGHSRRFPDGNFVEERELLTIEAFAAQGRGEQAKARARAFLARFPGSPHVARVKAVAGVP